MKTKQTFADMPWLHKAPFRASGFWVYDAKGTAICEAVSESVAKLIANTLNAQAQNNG